MGSLAAKVGTGGFQIAYTYAFAAAMPEQDFAWFLLLVSGVTFVGTLGTGGAADAAVRLVGHALKRGRGNALARTLSSAFALAALLSLALASAVVPTTAAIASLRAADGGDPPVWLFVLAALSIPAFALRAVAVGLIRGFGALALATVFEGTLVNGLLAACAVGMLIAGGASLGVAAAAFAAVSALVGMLALLTVGRLGSAVTGGEASFAVPALDRCRELFEVGAPLLTAGILGLLVGQMMIWLVAWLGTSRDVAVFGLGWQLFQAVNLVAMVGQAALGPRVVALALEERRDTLRRLLPSAAVLLAIGTLATLVLVTLAAATLDSVITIGLSEGAVTVAALLGLGLFGQLLFGANTMTLAMTGGEREVRRTALLCGATVLGLAPLGFLTAGTAGVAAAGALYSLSYGVMTACAVRRRLGFWPIARVGGNATWTR